MGKMSAERAAKMLADEGVIVTHEEAVRIVDFLRTLAKMAVAQSLRQDEESSPSVKTDTANQNTL
jgi:hypothetical protein